jgi:hypothetical protein
MTLERNEETGANDETARSRRFSDLLIPVLTAVGTGIGVLGFVMFFGGFILWTRFEAAGWSELPRSSSVGGLRRGGDRGHRLGLRHRQPP